MVRKTYQVFAENPAHPSLRYKKLAGHDGIWSVRINYSFRALAERKGDVITAKSLGVDDKGRVKMSPRAWLCDQKAEDAEARQFHSLAALDHLFGRLNRSVTAGDSLA